MALKIFNSQSCAVSEIHNLAAYEGNPKAAVESFCQQQVVTHGLDFKGFTAQPKTLFAFYMFNAPVYPKTPSTSRSKPLAPPYKDNYGEQFARYILENKLGSLTETPVAWNVVFHPDHGNKVWLWQPDRDALVAWYKPIKDAEAALKARIADKETVRSVVNGTIDTTGHWETVSTMSGRRCPKCPTIFTRGAPIYLLRAEPKGFICQPCAEGLGVAPYDSEDS